MQNNETTIDRRRLGPRESLLALGIAAGLFGLSMVQFENLNMFGLVLIVFFFFIAIWIRRAWAVYFLFALLVCFKFANVSNQIGLGRSSIDGWDIMFTIVAMIFAGCCFRFLELSRYVRAFYPALQESTTEKRAFQFPALMSGRWWLIPGSLVIALVLLRTFPYDIDAVRQYWITPSGVRTIMMGFFLFFIWFIFRSVVSLNVRKDMGTGQAAVRARSLIAKEFWNEQLPIENQRVKRRARF